MAKRNQTKNKKNKKEVVTITKTTTTYSSSKEVVKGRDRIDSDIVDRMHLKNVKSGIVKYGFFSNPAESTYSSIPDSDMIESNLRRQVIDFAIVQIMENNKGEEEREQAFKWMSTSAFDVFCDQCHLNVDYVLREMDKVFDVYSKTTVGCNWDRPNLSYITTVGSTVEW